MADPVEYLRPRFYWCKWYNFNKYFDNVYNLALRIKMEGVNITFKNQVC